MQNYLTRTNIIIGAVVILIIIGGAVYFGRKPSATTPGGGGILSNLFPTSGQKPPATPVGAPPQAPGAGNIKTVENLPIGAEQVKNLPIGTLIRLTENPISSLVPTVAGAIRYHKNIPESLGHLFERKADG